jgi:hypothetical protein
LKKLGCYVNKAQQEAPNIKMALVEAPMVEDSFASSIVVSEKNTLGSC